MKATAPHLEALGRIELSEAAKDAATNACQILHGLEGVAGVAVVVLAEPGGPGSYVGLVSRATPGVSREDIAGAMQAATADLLKKTSP